MQQQLFLLDPLSKSYNSVSTKYADTLVARGKAQEGTIKCLCLKKTRGARRKIKIIRVLKISGSICATAGGSILASNSSISPYGFIGLALSSSQLLLTSILERDLLLIINFGAIFLFVDSLGIYRWILQ